jgi:catechol 2,3-dioxygenase-like lactoylglutathione lyase family enzyme
MEPRFISVTPNLVVSDIDRSAAFYRDVLGLPIHMTVPGAAPFAFVWLKQDDVNIFLNDRATVGELDPHLADKPPGGSFTIYFRVTGVDALWERISPHAKIAEAINTKPYGMREFAVEDPDGYLITLSEEMGQR